MYVYIYIYVYIYNINAALMKEQYFSRFKKK